RELADDPAAGELVVHGSRVAVVVRLAPAAEAGPERVRRHRPVDGRARLVEHGEALVDDLDDVVRTDGGVRIGGSGVDREAAGRAAEPLAEPVEAEAECRRGRDPGARLSDGIGSGALRGNGES